jgi:hypothetical protein
MCGACGGPPPDPAGALVAGPVRRAAVARAVGAACPAVRVRAIPGGWTVATRTGRTTVCRTLDALVGAVAPHAVRPFDAAVGAEARAAVRVAHDTLAIMRAADG